MKSFPAGYTAKLQVSTWMGVVFACWVAGLGLTARAQEETPPAPPAAEAPSDADPPTTETTPETPEKPQSFLYIPYKDLKSAIDDINASVVVPLSEYLKLKQGAVNGAETRPAGAVLTSAEYQVSIEKDLAKIQAKLSVNVLGKPWVELPLSFGEAAIGKMTSSSENVLLRGNADGSYTLLLGASGEHQVDLELSLKVQSLPDGRQLAFTIPAVAVTTFDLTVPEADQTVEVQPRQVALPVEAAEGTTHVRASVGASNTIVAKWFPQKSATPQMELLTTATVAQLVSADEGLLHRDAWLRFEVLRGQVQQVRIAAPKGQRVLDVSGDAKIRGWKTAEEGNRQVITVDLLSPTSEAINVEVHTEGPLPEGAFPVAGLSAEGEAFGVHALDVVREGGQVAVRGGGALAVTIAEQQGLSRLDAGQTNEHLRSDNAPAFQYFAPAFTLRAEAKAIEPRVLVNHQAQLVFHEDELRVQSDLNYTIDRAGLFELRIAYPENLVIDDVQCPVMKEYRTDDTARVIIITLTEKTQGTTTVSVRAHRAFSAATDTTEQTLPIIEPQNVDRETGNIYVFAKEAIDVLTNEQGVVSAQPFAAPPGMQNGDARLTSSWSFTRRPVTIPVKTSRKPVRLSADVATTINVQPQITEVETLLTFITEYAGLDTFRLMVPEAVSARVRIESTDSGIAIRQQSPGAAEGGWVTWTVVLQREVLGSIPLKVSYDIRTGPGAANDSGQILILRPLGTKAVGDVDVPLTRVTGQIAVMKDDSLSVVTSAEGGDVEPIDVRELTLLPKTGASAFRYFRQPLEGAVAVTVARSRSDVQPVVATVIRRGLVEIVTGDKSDAAATYRCRFLMKTSERQRLLVQLPVNLELLGAFVNGRDVRLEKADLPSGQKLGESWDPFWLNVAREGSDDQEVSVSFQFLWKISPSLGGSGFSRGELELPLPVFGPTDAPSAVQDLRVAVWTPRDFVLVGEPEGFTRVDRPDFWKRILSSSYSSDVDLDSWLGDSSSPTTSLPKEGRSAFVYGNVGGANRLRVDWWQKASMAWLISAAVAFIALVLVRTSWENKLSVLLIAGFLVALYALRDFPGAVEFIAAARWGLLFLIVLWLIHGLLSRRRCCPVTAAPPPPAAPTPVPSGGL